MKNYVFAVAISFAATTANAQTAKMSADTVVVVKEIKPVHTTKFVDKVDEAARIWYALDDKGNKIILSAKARYGKRVGLTKRELKALCE